MSTIAAAKKMRLDMVKRVAALLEKLITVEPARFLLCASFALRDQLQPRQIDSAAITVKATPSPKIYVLISHSFLKEPWMIHITKSRSFVNRKLVNAIYKKCLSSKLRH